MSFSLYKDKTGKTWLVDIPGIQQLVRSYVRSGALLRRSAITYEPQDMGPLGFFFPLTLATVQTNFKGLQNEVDAHSNALLSKLMPQLQASGLAAFNTLVGYRNETVKFNNLFRNMQVQASQLTNEEVGRVQKNSAAAMEITKAIRDVSATTLMVGATFLSGGAAAAFMSGASVMKGTFTFQDKKMAGGSTSAALIAGGVEASTDLVVGLVGIGESTTMTAAFASKATSDAKLAAGVLVLTGAQIDGTCEFVKATIDGKTVRQALILAATQAGLHVLSAGVGTALNKVFSAPRLEGLSFPVTLTRSTKEVASVSEFATASWTADGSDALMQWMSDGTGGESAAWHSSVALTLPQLGNSDSVYVEQHAMRASGR